MEKQNIQFQKDKNNAMDLFELLKLKAIQYSDEDPSFDPESVLYNEIDTVLDEIDVITSYEELAEIINKGKQIEHNLDVWLSRKGRTTLSIQWPKSR